MGLFRSGMADQMTTALFGKAEETVYKRPLVTIGAIVRINYGELANKLCTIVDIVDSGRLLVEGPENLTGVPRMVQPLKRVTLTGMGLNITRNARQKQLTKAWTDGKIMEKYSASAYAKTLKKRETRASMTDFDRFKLMLARKAKSVQMTASFKKLKKAK